DVTLIKISCVSMSDVDFSEYGHRLIHILRKEF
ncbi:unnamed protein product, partial [Rotaria magnacalcarata]